MIQTPHLMPADLWRATRKLVRRGIPVIDKRAHQAGVMSACETVASSAEGNEEMLDQG